MFTPDMRVFALKGDEFHFAAANFAPAQAIPFLGEDNNRPTLRGFVRK